jgi:rhodanese-related sulfurtransferase
MELRDLMINPDIALQLFDLRSESDYNLFHLESAVRVERDDLLKPTWVKKFLTAPPNRIVVLISNDDLVATEEWKKLRGMDVINLYILDGGLNHWLKIFPLDPRFAKPRAQTAPEGFAFAFLRSAGDSQFSSFPYDPVRLEKNLKLDFTKKVKMQTKSAVKGGCG